MKKCLIFSSMLLLSIVVEAVDFVRTIITGEDGFNETCYYDRDDGKVTYDGEDYESGYDAGYAMGLNQDGCVAVALWQSAMKEAARLKKAIPYSDEYSISTNEWDDHTFAIKGIRYASKSKGLTTRFKVPTIDGKNASGEEKGAAFSWLSPSSFFNSNQFEIDSTTSGDGKIKIKGLTTDTENMQIVTVNKATTSEDTPEIKSQKASTSLTVYNNTFGIDGWESPFSIDRNQTLPFKKLTDVLTNDTNYSNHMILLRSEVVEDGVATKRASYLPIGKLKLTSNPDTTSIETNSTGKLAIKGVNTVSNAGKVLSTDGAGNVSWITKTGGAFDIVNGQLINRYYNVGGKTYSAGEKTVSGVTGVLALVLSATSSTATYTTYADFGALQTAQNDLTKYIMPLYQFSNGNVEIDLRASLNAVMMEY